MKRSLASIAAVAALAFSTLAAAAPLPYTNVPLNGTLKFNFLVVN